VREAHSPGPLRSGADSSRLPTARIEPIDAGRVERIEVRVAACANCDLEVELRPGRFREDPYYQLAAIKLFVPACAIAARRSLRWLPN
jgi:transcriptional regulator of acetoin/glycerol metabolism